MRYVANTLPYFAYTHRCMQNTLVCYQNAPWAVTLLSCNTPRAFFFNSAVICTTVLGFILCFPPLDTPAAHSLDSCQLSKLQDDILSYNCIFCLIWSVRNPCRRLPRNTNCTWSVRHPTNFMKVSLSSIVKYFIVLHANCSIPK